MAAASKASLGFLIPNGFFRSGPFCGAQPYTYSREEGHPRDPLTPPAMVPAFYGRVCQCRMSAAQLGRCEGLMESSGVEDISPKGDHRTEESIHRVTTMAVGHKNF